MSLLLRHAILSDGDLRLFQSSTRAANDETNFALVLESRHLSEVFPSLSEHLASQPSASVAPRYHRQSQA